MDYSTNCIVPIKFFFGLIKETGPAGKAAHGDDVAVVGWTSKWMGYKIVLPKMPLLYDQRYDD